MWEEDPTSDIGRMARLTDLVGRVVAAAMDGGAIDLDDLVLRVLPKLTVDDRLTVAESRCFVATARSLRDIPLDTMVVPSRLARAGDVDMLEVLDVAAAPTFLLDGPGPPSAGGPATPDFFAVRPWPGPCT